MKNAREHSREIAARLGAARGFVLFLDFDGTLAPIAPTPAHAAMSAETRSLLRRTSRFFPVTVVSGRALRDLEQKVGLQDLAYAGNHGLEWNINGRRYQKKLPFKMLYAMREARAILKPLAAAYPRAILEDKKLALGLHYRNLPASEAAAFRKEIIAAAAPFIQEGSLRAIKGKKVVELRPAMDWDKGDFILFLYKKIMAGKKNILPIYIGDDATDEDAFRALGREGLTIRVGSARRSAAEYCFTRRKQVDQFINRLLAFTDSRTGSNSYGSNTTLMQRSSLPLNI